MNTKFSIVFSVFFIFSVFCACAIAQEPPLLQDDELEIQAGGEVAYDESGDVLTASGGVSVKTREYEISSPLIVVDRASGTLTAEGPILIRRGVETFSGQRLQYNYRTRDGEMIEAAGCYRGINVWGERLEFSSDTALFHGAMASTCGRDALDYHIRADTVEVTPDRRVKFKKIGLYVKNRRVFKWKSYTMSLGANGPSATPGRSIGGARFKPPTLGYAGIGGVNVKTGLVMPLEPDTLLTLNAAYYALDGFFPQFEGRRTHSYQTVWVKAGKEYKENTGYFRYLTPVVVWNLPMAGVDYGLRLVPGTRVQFQFTAEAGRLKEARLSKPKYRGFAKLYVRYPLNPKRNIVYSLIADTRYGVYSEWLKYRVFGTGLSVDWIHCTNSKHVVQLQYLHFVPEGRTYFISDLVDSNDKIYFNTNVKVSQFYRIGVNGEFDIDDSRYDEVELLVSRTYNCVRIDFGWRKELNRVMLRLNILGLKSEDNN